jgi:hypothetical protein
MFTGNNTQIGILRIKIEGDNTPSLCLSLSNMLSNADMRPKGISPSAILIIRDLSDPLPGRLKPRPGVMQVDATWEQAVQSALSRIYHQAVRPVNGYIPSNADAVLFADEGEMLACLALDMKRGEAFGRWWWKVVMKNFSAPGNPGDLLCSRGIFVPAALHHLVEWDKAEEVVSSLSPGQALSVISCICTEFKIPDFSTGTVLAFPASDKVISQNEYAGPGREVLHVFSTELRTSSGSGPQTGQWERRLLSLPQRIGKERVLLLGLGLSLYQEPDMVRMDTFVRQVRKWWHSQEVSGEEYLYERSPDMKRPVHETRVHKTPVSNTRVHETSVHETPGRETPAPSSRMQDMDLTRYDTAGETGSDDGGFTIDNENRMTAPEQFIFEEEKAGQVRHQDSTVVEKVPGSEVKEGIGQTGESHSRNEPIHREESPAFRESNERTEIPSIKPAEPLEEAVNTRLGGIFYLINLMRKLDLPACFEEGWQLASQLGSWGTLDVLGRALSGQELAEDPVWNVLAQLGGRESGELPGAVFYGNPAYRLPAGWLTYVSADSIYYTAFSGQRLRLWSEEYLIFDCQADEPALEELVEKELKICSLTTDPAGFVSSRFDQAPVENITGTLVEGLHPDLKGWLTMVMPFIRFWLRHALNYDGDISEMLLLCAGRLYITSTHVDLVMRMEDISLPVRMAGLDIDPGWLPDFGRVIQFHFE